MLSFKVLACRCTVVRPMQYVNMVLCAWYVCRTDGVFGMQITICDMQIVLKHKTVQVDIHDIGKRSWKNISQDHKRDQREKP